MDRMSHPSYSCFWTKMLKNEKKIYWFDDAMRDTFLKDEEWCDSVYPFKTSGLIISDVLKNFRMAFRKIRGS